MKLGRRQFITLAASAAAVLPALSLRRAPAQSLPNPAGVSAPSASERAAMARPAHAFMEKYDVPALSFAVGYAGEIVHRDAFGLADRERNEAVTPMHLFRIASVSKTITSTTIFGLIEQGRLKLVDKVFGPGGITGTDYGRPPYKSRGERNHPRAAADPYRRRLDQRFPRSDVHPSQDGPFGADQLDLEQSPAG